jgi:hypothetical protein
MQLLGLSPTMAGIFILIISYDTIKSIIYFLNSSGNPHPPSLPSLAAYAGCYAPQ